MLFDSFKEQELIWQENVLGQTSCSKEAFRGDLAIVLGDIHESSNTRNQPKLVLFDAATLSEGEAFSLFSGGLEAMDDIPALFEQYGKFLTDETKIILFVVNAADEMITEYEGKTLFVYPYDEGMLWQLLMDVLYVEKSDLKGQSAEDKLVTMADAAKDLKAKTVLAFDEASTKTREAKRETFGAV